MGSLSERRCANGEQCAWYGQDGKPAKLRRSSKDKVCERCRKEGISPAMFRMPTIDPSQPRKTFFNLLQSSGTEILKSDEGERMVRFKRELVLSLFLKQGEFWNEIRAMRERWNITAASGFPPGGAWAPHPFPTPTDETELKTRKDFDRQLRGLEYRVVPERFRQALSSDWERFFALCVMHEPPDDGLLEFAAQGGPYPVAIWDPLEGWGEDDPVGYIPPADLRMALPPVKWLRDPDEAALAKACFYRKMLQAIGERHLSPLGIDVWELFYEVWENCPEIRKELQEEGFERNRAQPHIEVNDWTTSNDVRNGLRLIRQARPQRPVEGRPKRDPLVAVQCALHHDRYNRTYEQIAEHYEWMDPSRVGKYVREGRKILGTTG